MAPTQNGTCMHAYMLTVPDPKLRRAKTGHACMHTCLQCLSQNAPEAKWDMHAYMHTVPEPKWLRAKMGHACMHTCEQCLSQNSSQPNCRGATRLPRFGNVPSEAREDCRDACLVQVERQHAAAARLGATLKVIRPTPDGACLGCSERF